MDSLVLKLNAAMESGELDKLRDVEAEVKRFEINDLKEFNEILSLKQQIAGIISVVERYNKD